MDIEKLKGKWKNYTADFQHKDLGDKDEFIKKIHKKSQQSLKKLRKNFFLEAGINILAIPILLLFVFNNLYENQTSKLVLIIVIATAVVAFFVYLFLVYKRIYNLEDTGLSLQEKLEKQVHQLRTFISYYHKITYTIFVVVLLLAVFLDFPDNLKDQIISITGIVVVGVIMFFLVLRPITKFYVKKLYGNHLKALENYLDELK